MSFLQHALHLASRGFRVFPCVPGTKFPAIDDFPSRATTDEKQIREWWTDPILEIEQPYNIGISTNDLCVVDVDNKGEKRGDDEILKLEMEGFEFPPTFEQRTPTGGRHFIYRVEQSVKQGVNVLGAGLDIRSRGGFVLGSGSEVEEGRYSATEREIALAPEWIVTRCGRDRVRVDHDTRRSNVDVNQERASERARHYLLNEAPLSVEGDGGDETAFVVACRVKDFGVDQSKAVELMGEHWNPRCTPPWSIEEIRQKVNNAYNYGRDPVGVSAPEKAFDKVVTSEETKPSHPIASFNKEYAYLPQGMTGGIVIHETKDPLGRATVKYMGLSTFHNYHASKTISFDGGKTALASKLWMSSPDRRTYQGLCFMPEQKAPPEFYNFWRGFAVKPYANFAESSKNDRASLEAYLEHASANVCDGKQDLFDWLMGFFAHMIQRPWEKPLVALVLQGGKGTGKNALVERVGYLLGSSFFLTSKKRHLVGNFNGHLENRLFMALDEAFWSGDKEAEGALKDLITGSRHIIERKGMESYEVTNCTRVAILGNEPWLVPASHDERRFAVFRMGDRRKQDKSFFEDMRTGMEKGGYRLLMRYLLDFDLKKTDVNSAPFTAALAEQKLESQGPIEQWWFGCLSEGRIIGADFGGEWPIETPKESVRMAIRRYLQERNVRSRYPDPVTVGKELKRFAPAVVSARRRNDGGFETTYRFPSLERARDEWCAYIGHQIEWENK